jgi:hypothetical protein
MLAFLEYRNLEALYVTHYNKCMLSSQRHWATFGCDIVIQSGEDWYKLLHKMLIGE